MSQPYLSPPFRPHPLTHPRGTAGYTTSPFPVLISCISLSHFPMQPPPCSQKHSLCFFPGGGICVSFLALPSGLGNSPGLEQPQLMVILLFFMEYFSRLMPYLSGYLLEPVHVWVSQDTITEYHKLHRLSNRNVFSHSSGDWKLEIFWSLLFGLLMAIFFTCSSFCVYLWPNLLFWKDTSHIGLGSALMVSL